MRTVLQSIAQGVETLSAAAQELSVRSTETSSNTQVQSGKTDSITVALRR